MGRLGLGVGGGPLAAGALLALAAVARQGLILHGRIDPDESQHLHAAWLVGQGARPYLDFWEHHGPLLYYLLAPLTRWFADSPAVYAAGRAAMSLAAAGALVLTYRLGRRLSTEVGWTAAAVLAVLPTFGEATTEIRPDVPALVAWLASLLALVSWHESGRSGWLWTAGAWLGIAGVATPKAAYGALGALLAVGIRAGARGSVLSAIGALARLGLGAAAPGAALAAWIWLDGGRAGLIALGEQLVRDNLRFVDFAKAWPIRGEEAGFAALAAAGIVLAARRRGLASAGRPVHGVALVASAVVALALALPWTPAVYRQAWLPLLPVGAVYAALVLSALRARWARPDVRRGRALLALVALGGGLAVPAAASVRDALRADNTEQLQTMRRLLELSCPGEPVLDGTALYVFRPAAYRYGVLVTGVREWIARGIVAEERIEEDLRRARPRAGYRDRRLRALVGPVRDFLERHYVEVGDGLLLAGASVRVPGGPGGGRQYVDLLAEGPYRLAADPGIDVWVDGTPQRRGWVALAAGRHAVTWTGPPGGITLLAATCPERRP